MTIRIWQVTILFSFSQFKGECKWLKSCTILTHAERRYGAQRQDHPNHESDKLNSATDGVL